MISILRGSRMQPAKRVNIVSLKLVREGSVLYRERRVQSPEDAYQLHHMAFPFC